ENQVELVAAIALGEHGLTGLVGLFHADVGQALQAMRGQAREQLNSAQEVGGGLGGCVGVGSGGGGGASGHAAILNQCERNRSASMAAMQPVPAAVTAWR